MKRAIIILVCGAALALLAGAGVYYARTASHRAMLCCARPELAWLQHEFQLTDAQFARVEKMHNDYLVHCKELCDRIAATNKLIHAQISTNTAVTAETQTLLASAARLRVECQTRMLEECTAVSREMSPEQGKRYLAWVQEQILAMPNGSMTETSPPAHGH
jgi:hypothetical protein